MSECGIKTVSQGLKQPILNFPAWMTLHGQQTGEHSLWPDPHVAVGRFAFS